MTAPVYGTMTRAEILSIVRSDKMLKDLGARDSFRQPPRIRGVGGRPICPLPLPDPSASEIIAMAVDASEHGLPAPSNMRARSAFRIVREAQAQSQRDMMKRIKKKPKNG